VKHVKPKEADEVTFISREIYAHTCCMIY